MDPTGREAARARRRSHRRSSSSRTRRPATTHSTGATWARRARSVRPMLAGASARPDRVEGLPRHIASCSADTTSIQSSGRCNQLDTSKARQADRRRRCRNDDACVQDELHRRLRDSATAATQFGAGVPSSRRSHSGGIGSIGYSSSRMLSRSAGSITRRRPSTRAGRRPSRIQRRTVSRLRPTRLAASSTVSMPVIVRRVPAAARQPGSRFRAAGSHRRRPRRGWDSNPR